MSRSSARPPRAGRRELADERLDDGDCDFIRTFNTSPQRAATGYLQAIVVVYPMPDGGPVAGVGPVFSHYEFKRPLSGRLTDDAWRAMLKKGEAPPAPPWTAGFTVGGRAER